MSSERFGNYRLVEEIGRGSAGIVFAGEYGALRRPIAIKVLHDHLVADGSADRMLIEARALSVIDHPGIVKVIDCGMTHDGRAFIVMEYLVGELLHQRLQRGPLLEQQLVMFARQLASALEVAHAAGIIHRDVKPENAFIVPDPDVPGGERIKLLDFGIAKCGDQERTETGVVLGTPAYMAPEQFTRSRRVDHRVDIYALGVVMYAMATGTLPFEGSNTDELRAEHSYCLPRPATAAGVSDRVSKIIDRCLAKQPHDRFASMADLGTVLRELELEDVSDQADEVVDEPIGAELDDVETAAIVPTIDLDVRRRMPWRVLGAVAAITLALVYVRFEDSDSPGAASPPSEIVERESTLSIEQPAVEPSPVPEPRRVARTIDTKADPPRRDSTRARQKPARSRKIESRSKAPASETQAPTKEEDYASVTPPTLY